MHYKRKMSVKLGNECLKLDIQDGEGAGGRHVKSSQVLGWTQQQNTTPDSAFGMANDERIVG